MRRCLTIALVLAAFAMPSRSYADVIAYSNVTNFSGFAYANGGATNQAGNTITNMVADDILAASGLGGYGVTGFSFSVANLNTTAVSARARVRFYQSDGGGSAPGTYITGFTFNPITFAASNVTVFSYSPGSVLFTMPTTLFWAAITFDNNTGTTGATAAQLNNLGQGIFSPPTVGSSQDVFFQTSAAGSFVGNNPAGGLFFFGGSPVANFGWSFTVAVPEPSPLLMGGGLTVFGFVVSGIRARLRKPAAPVTQEAA